MLRQQSGGELRKTVRMNTKPYYELAKRFLDFLVAAIALTFLAPILAVVALLIKLDSPGPVFYRLMSVGRGERLFNRFKFRTMITGHTPRSEHMWELDRDPRVTRIGLFLRRTNLDEIPQLFQVLMGQMSLVGPRAQSPSVFLELSSMIPEYRSRLAVQPGLTGLAQVSLLLGSSSYVRPALMFEYDCRYIRNRSLWLDIKIMTRTMLVGLGLETLISGRPLSTGHAPLDAEWARALRAVLMNNRQEFSVVARDIARYLEHNVGIQLTSWYTSSNRIEAFGFDTSIAFRDTNLPDTLPIALLFGTSLDKADLPELHRLLLSAIGAGQHVGLLILFGDHLSLRSSVGLLETSMKRAYACDIVAVGLEELQSLVLRREPQEELRRLVLSQVDLLSISPFVITGPVSDTVFFGRERELREIVEHATTASFAVIGGRRIGKSSLLARLHRIRLPAGGFSSLYFDCSASPNCDAFLATEIRHWQPEALPGALGTFGELLQLPPSDRPLVLLLDEADKLIPTDRANGWKLFGRLRAFANSGHGQIILGGERTLRSALQDTGSPLFNFTNEILLGPLDCRDVEELVTRPMKQLEIELVDAIAIVDRIWTFTSGHPNVVQRLCRRVIERLNERGGRLVALDDVNAVIEDPSFQRDDFLSTYWEAATPLERIISLLMADKENVRTLRTVREALAVRCGLQLKPREVDDALQRLVDLRSILKHTPAGYQFAVGAFPRVVAGTMTLADMLEILTEEYQEQGE